MTIDFALGDYIRQLRKAGLRPSERLVNNIVRAGPLAVRPLLELATSVELLHQEPPEGFAPLHALRLLGEVPSVEMIEPLIAQIPLELEYEEERQPQMWGEEAPQIIARIGAPAVEPLWQIADDTARPLSQRTFALMALAYTTAVAPEVRDAISQGLRERLGKTDDGTMNAYLLVSLGDIGSPDIYAEAMKLYREGRVNTHFLPPGTARQILLAKGEGRIACARHPLWERYDQHGPFEQQQAGQ